MILCGLLTSSALKMFVVPTLYRMFGSLVLDAEDGLVAEIPTELT